MSGHQLPGTTLRQRTAAAVADDRLTGNVARAVDRFVRHRTRGWPSWTTPTPCAGRPGREAPGPGRPAGPARTVRRPGPRRGGHVCWAASAADARDYVIDVVGRHGPPGWPSPSRWPPRRSTSTTALEAAGAEVVETDLGEWIIQLAGETPSHIITPALHRDRHQIKDLFVDTVAAPPDLGSDPRAGELRPAAAEGGFLAAEVGITGANFGVAETRSAAHSPRRPRSGDWPGRSRPNRRRR